MTLVPGSRVRVRQTLINKADTIIKCCSCMNLVPGSHVHYADTYK